MRTYLTMAATAALACPLPAIPAAAQEATVAEALEYLRRGERPTSTPAARILRQVDGRGDPAPRTAAELDALADQAAAMALDATLPDRVRRQASYALMTAASSKSGRGYDGTPYPRAFDLLVRAYESGYDDALIRIGRDEFLERGMAYVRELFERSERPPLCRWDYESGRNEPPECVRGFHTFHYTPWCEAGGYLFKKEVAAAWERAPALDRRSAAGYPRPFPPGLPEHVEDWHRRCR